MSSHPLPIQEPPQEYSHLKSIPLLLPKGLTFDFSTGSVSGSAEQGLYLVEEAICLLEKLVGSQGPLSIVNIVGPARTGKSYVASRLLGSANAFELGHTMNAKTMGVWLATRTLKGNNATILVLDTEGLDAHSADQRRDDGIFLLSVLLSSFLIYNSTGVPKSNDINKMAYIIRLAQRIDTGSGGSTGQDFRLHFPHLLWLLRDHFLKPTIGNREVTPTEYLNREVLRFQGGFSDIERTNNDIRRAILTFFRSIECVTLPSPSINQEILRNMDTADPEKLEEEFKVGMNKLVELVLSRADSPKTLGNGSVVTAPVFVELMKNLVRAVNDPNVVVSIPSLVEIVQKEVWNSFERESVQKFVDFLEGLVPSFPLEESELIAAASNYYREDILKNSKQISIEQRLFQILSQQLLERLIKKGSPQENMIDGGEIHRYIVKNREVSEAFCQNLVKDLWKPIAVKLLNAGYSMEDLQNDLENFHLQFANQGRGPAKLKVAAQNMEFLKEQELYFSQLKGFQKQLFEQELQTRQEKLRCEEAEQKNNNLQNQYQELQKNYTSELQTVANHHQAQIQVMKKEFEERQNQEQQRLLQFMQTKFEDDAKCNQEMIKSMQESQINLISKMDESNKQMLGVLQEIAKRPPPPVEVIEKNGGGILDVIGGLLKLVPVVGDVVKTVDKIFNKADK